MLAPVLSRAVSLRQFLGVAPVGLDLVAGAQPHGPTSQTNVSAPRERRRATNVLEAAVLFSDFVASAPHPNRVFDGGADQPRPDDLIDDGGQGSALTQRFVDTTLFQLDAASRRLFPWVRGYDAGLLNKSVVGLGRIFTVDVDLTVSCRKCSMSRSLCSLRS